MQAESSKTGEKMYRENYFPSTEFKVAEQFKRLKNHIEIEPRHALSVDLL